ncbi:MAG: isoprenylcysteine carboxylmethyltransferase family protein [Elusimicrobia bacterium]|nr:isoprenylcysteine carboxylmethyltransferase family protein [Elusimicrobiota bacterium]
MKNRMFISYIIFIGLLLISRPDSYTLFFIGVFFTILGLSIRMISSGTILKNKKLATNGIYSVVRNPLYLGTFTSIFGILIQLSSLSEDKILNTLSVWIISLIGFGFIYYRTIKNEEEYLKKVYADDFIKYMKETPSIIPAISRLSEVIKKEYYSKEAFKKNKEYRGIVGFLILEIIILLKIRY